MGRATAGRLRRPGGTPIEEAPAWALVLLAGVLWLIAFPAVVGILAVAAAWRGQRLAAAGAALAIALAVVAGAALQKPWRRPTGPGLADPRPLFVRFSTWLITALLLPNVLFGALVLGRPETPLGYREAAALALLVSCLHGAWALAERWRGRRGPPAAP